MGTSWKPLSSSALRSAATRPSIMSEGATMSAPARACATASLASSARVMSLSTTSSLPGAPTRAGFRTPQCPWSVYSHMQTSVMTTRPGTSFFSARTARGMMPSSSHAPEPCASFFSGTPKRMTLRTPASKPACASATSSSTESWNTPGMLLTAFLTRCPGTAKSGQTRSEGASSVSRTRLRRASVRRMRRGRSWGKGMANAFCRAGARPPPPFVQTSAQILVDPAHHEPARELRIEEGALLRHGLARFGHRLDLPHRGGVHEEAELVLAGERPGHHLARVHLVADVLPELLRALREAEQVLEDDGVERRHVQLTQGDVPRQRHAGQVGVVTQGEDTTFPVFAAHHEEGGGLARVLGELRHGPGSAGGAVQVLDERVDREEPTELVEEAPELEARQAGEEPVRRVDDESRIRHRAERHHDEAMARVRAEARRLAVDQVAVGERRLVPVVPIGDERLAGGQHPPERLDRARLLDPPQAVARPVVRVGLCDRLAGAGDGRLERPVSLGAFVLVEREDGREVRLHPLQELEPVGLGSGERLLVREDDALLVGVQPAGGDEAPSHPRPPVGAGEALLERVERRLGIAAEGAIGEPALERLRGAEVLVVGRSVAGLVLAERDVDEVVRAARRELVPGHGRHRVIRRRDEPRQCRRPGGRVSDAAERKHVGHAPRTVQQAPHPRKDRRGLQRAVAASICGHGMAPARRSRTVSPDTATMVLGTPPGAGPASRTSSSRARSAADSSPTAAGGGSPARFALVETSGAPAASASARATSEPGMRMATVPSPPRTSGSRPGAAGRTSVSAPGQKRPASARASGAESDATPSTCARSPAMSGRGFPSERSFAPASRRSASGCVTSAPSP